MNVILEKHKSKEPKRSTWLKRIVHLIMRKQSSSEPIAPQNGNAGPGKQEASAQMKCDVGRIDTDNIDEQQRRNLGYIMRRRYL